MQPPPETCMECYAILWTQHLRYFPETIQFHAENGPSKFGLSADPTPPKATTPKRCSHASQRLWVFGGDPMRAQMYLHTAQRSASMNHQKKAQSSMKQSGMLLQYEWSNKSYRVTVVKSTAQFHVVNVSIRKEKTTNVLHMSLALQYRAGCKTENSHQRWRWGRFKVGKGGRVV